MNEEVRRYFDKQTEFCFGHLEFRDCRFYPCHEAPEGGRLNCLFCYCPIYPCGIAERGGKPAEKDPSVWDCSGCNFIHRDATVKRILEMIYEGKNIKTINEQLMESERRLG